MNMIENGIKNRNKSLIIGLAIVLLLLVVNSSYTVFFKAATNIVDDDFVVKINGELVEFNDVYGHPKIIKSTKRTLIPLRYISEKMGYDVTWNEKTKTATIKGGGSTVHMTIGESTAVVNGKRVPIDVDENNKPLNTRAVLLNVKGNRHKRTYVPLRFVSEATNAKVGYKWAKGVHYINITTKKEKPPVEDVSFIEPEIIVTQLTNATHVSNYFTMRLGNRKDYENTGITISTELTNWDDFIHYRLPKTTESGYFVTNDNKYYSNWSHDRISKGLGKFYELGRMSYAKKINSDKKVSLPPEGYILKYKVTVTVQNETKVYDIDVPFHHKKFDLDNY